MNLENSINYFADESNLHTLSEGEISYEENSFDSASTVPIIPKVPTDFILFEAEDENCTERSRSEDNASYDGSFIDNISVEDSSGHEAFCLRSTHDVPRIGDLRQPAKHDKGSQSSLEHKRRRDYLESNSCSSDKSGSSCSSDNSGRCRYSDNSNSSGCSENSGSSGCSDNNYVKDSFLAGDSDSISEEDVFRITMQKAAQLVKQDSLREVKVERITRSKTRKRKRFIYSSDTE